MTFDYEVWIDYTATQQKVYLQTHSHTMFGGVWSWQKAGGGSSKWDISHQSPMTNIEVFFVTDCMILEKCNFHRCGYSAGERSTSPRKLTRNIEEIITLIQWCTLHMKKSFNFKSLLLKKKPFYPSLEHKGNIWQKGCNRNTQFARVVQYRWITKGKK